MDQAPPRKSKSRLVLFLFIGIAIFFGIFITALFVYPMLKFSLNFDQLTHPDNEKRVEAIKAFKEMSPKRKDQLIKKVENLPREERRQIMMEFLKNDAVDMFTEQSRLDFLRDVLYHGDPSHGNTAFYALRDMGEKGNEILQRVFTLMKDDLEVSLRGKVYYQHDADEEQMQMVIKNTAGRNLWYTGDNILAHHSERPWSYHNRMRGIPKAKDTDDNSNIGYYGPSSSYRQSIARMRWARRGGGGMAVEAASIPKYKCLRPDKEIVKPFRPDFSNYYYGHGDDFSDPWGEHKTLWFYNFEEHYAPLKKNITSEQDLDEIMNKLNKKEKDKKAREFTRVRLPYVFLPSAKNSVPKKSCPQLDILEPKADAVFSASENISVTVTLKNTHNSIEITLMRNRMKMWVFAADGEFEERHFAVLEFTIPPGLKCTSRLLWLTPGAIISGKATFGKPFPPGTYKVFAAYEVPPSGRMRGIWESRVAAAPITITVK